MVATLQVISITGPPAEIVCSKKNTSRRIYARKKKKKKKKPFEGLKGPISNKSLEQVLIIKT